MDIFLGEIGEGSSVTLATAPWLSLKASSALCFHWSPSLRFWEGNTDLRVAEEKVSVLFFYKQGWCCPCSSSWKAQAWLPSLSDQRLYRLPFGPAALSTQLLSSRLPSFLFVIASLCIWAQRRENEFLFVLFSPHGDFEISLHLLHVWRSATLWLMIVLCLTCCWIFKKTHFSYSIRYTEKNVKM